MRTPAHALQRALAIANDLPYMRVMTKENHMTVADSRTFRSGNSEAVRLPRNVAFGREVEVTIVRSGDVLTIYPARKRAHPALRSATMRAYRSGRGFEAWHFY